MKALILLDTKLDVDLLAAYQLSYEVRSSSLMSEILIIISAALVFMIMPINNSVNEIKPAFFLLLYIF